jgi:hypothetical protein
MIDFPITDLFGASLCLLWLERHLHPDGFVCPTCGSANRRRFRSQGYYDTYRCRECTGYYVISNVIVEKKNPRYLALRRSISLVRQSVNRTS